VNRQTRKGDKGGSVGFLYCAATGAVKTTILS
jgi:hypothetical protein